MSDKKPLCYPTIKNTPTPLELHIGDDYLEITNGGSNGVLQMRYPDQYDKRHAAYIVKAVNEYESLKSCLTDRNRLIELQLADKKELVEALKHYASFDEGKIAQAVLAKAGVK